MTDKISSCGVTHEGLLPCPFCAVAPRIKTYPVDPYRLRGHIEISCENNHCPAQVVVEESSEDEAAAHWNRRTSRSEIAEFPRPTNEEIAAYRDLFRSELDKNMNNSSGSPSTDAHTVALHKFVEARNKTRRFATAGSDLDQLAAIMVKDDADVDICPPGNHGGSGENQKKWLITIMPSDHRNIREFFGSTLAEAIHYAALRLP